MMKKRNIFYFAFWICFLITLSSCEAEREFIEKTNEDRDLKIRNISFEEFKTNNSALNSLKTVQNLSTNNSFQRYLYDPNSNLIIDTGTIKEISTSSNYKSYTVLVIDEQEPEKVKNLLLSEKYNNEYDAYLLKYNLSDADKLKILNNESVDLVNKTEVFVKSTTMNDLSNPVRIDADGNCYVVDKIWQEGGVVFWNILYVDCPNGMGGSSSSDSGNGDNNSNAGTFWIPIGYPSGNNQDETSQNNGGTENNEPVITEPVIPTKNDDNCNDLKSKSFNQDFKNKMNELKGDSNGYFETGFQMFANAPKFTDKKWGTLLDPSGINFDEPSRPDCIGFMHCHLNNSTNPDANNFAIFTPKDFTGLTGMLINSTRPINEITMYLTVNVGSNNFTYAIKIKDVNKFIDMCTNMNNETERYKRMWERNIKTTNTPEKQVNEFLKIMENEKFDEGIELYKCDENYQNWEQLILNATKNTIKIKC